MTRIGQYINSFSILGNFLDQFIKNTRSENKDLSRINELYYDSFRDLVKNVNKYNPWFTEECVTDALAGIRFMLQREHLETWLSGYPELNSLENPPKNVGIVMAGNIPLVGFHDFLCVLLSGNRVIGKPASKDEHLIKVIADILVSIEPELSDRINFVEEYLHGIDAVIATGSDNTSRYFNYYFRNIPALIRKNRNSIAVLNGSETDSQLYELGKDIFTFFGLGCRNVTKIYLPSDYDLTRIMSVFEVYMHLYNHHKYANNIDYYRTIYLMNRVAFLDNGALLLTENKGLSSPVGVVYYEKYSEIEHIERIIEANRDHLQCIISTEPVTAESILPGTSQRPFPWDYADKVDTLNFLIQI